MLGGRLACISLNGFVFFGCANSIGQRLQEVRRDVLVAGTCRDRPTAARPGCRYCCQASPLMPHPDPHPPLHCPFHLPALQMAEQLGGSWEGEAAAREQSELEEAIVTSLRTVGERYVGVKHTQVGGQGSGAQGARDGRAAAGCRTCQLARLPEESRQLKGRVPPCKTDWRSRSSPRMPGAGALHRQAGALPMRHTSSNGDGCAYSCRCACTHACALPS